MFDLTCPSSAGGATCSIPSIGDKITVASFAVATCYLSLITRRDSREASEALGIDASIESI